MNFFVYIQNVTPLAARSVQRPREIYERVAGVRSTHGARCKEALASPLLWSSCNPFCAQRGVPSASNVLSFGQVLSECHEREPCDLAYRCLPLDLLARQAVLFSKVGGHAYIPRTAGDTISSLRLQVRQLKAELQQARELNLSYFERWRRAEKKLAKG
jgi:hypothetical protein